MKKLLLFILLTGFIACAEKAEKKEKKNPVTITSTEALEKKGFELYDINPKEALPVFKQVAIAYESGNNAKKAASTNLNIANIYDEHLNQVDSALMYAYKSLTIWSKQNDPIQKANLYKYIGLLNGRFGKYEVAKSDIQRAIELYRTQNFNQGIAVSRINLADVFLREGNFKESERLFLESKKFWQEKGDNGRVFTDNLLGIQLYGTSKKGKECQQLIEENRELEKGIPSNEMLKNKFEQLIEKYGKAE